MSTQLGKRKVILAMAMAMGVGLLATSALPVQAQDVKQTITLSGANEVPPVQSAGSATGEVTVKADGSVSGSVKVTGIKPTAAHIHQAAAGANGPVIVPMVKQGDDTFVFPPNAKMNADQLKAFKAGNTYVNVHTEANKAGELRAQLKGN